jgi:hypothetical protein
MRQLLVTLSLAAAATTLGGCAVSSESITFEDNGTPRHEHGWQDWWNYQMVYHPNDQVYYEPYSGTYHWFQDETWYTGDKLPRTLTPDPELAQVVFLQDGQFPWAQHNTTSFQHASRRPFRPAQHDAVAHARTNGWMLPNEGETFANVSTENDRPD